jgi:hypothetical protein
MRWEKPIRLQQNGQDWGPGRGQIDEAVPNDAPKAAALESAAPLPLRLLLLLPLPPLLLLLLLLP